MFGVHSLGQNDFENRVHPFAFFNGDINNLGNFAFDVFAVVKYDGVFEYGNVLFGPVRKMSDPEFFINEGQKFKDFAAILDFGFNVHQAGQMHTLHIGFPGKKEEHIVPFALNFHNDFVDAAALQFKRAA